jgi:hypothetical protein
MPVTAALAHDLHAAVDRATLIVVAVAVGSVLVATEVDHVTANVAVDHVSAAEIADEIARELTVTASAMTDNATRTATETGNCHATV